MQKGGVGALLVGTSSWIYPHWVDVFYPGGLPQSGWLAFYAERFSTVEVNYSFYRLPRRQPFEHWRRSTPDGFVFAVKASRFIRHMKKLRDSPHGTPRRSCLVGWGGYRPG